MKKILLLVVALFMLIPFPKTNAWADVMDEFILSYSYCTPLAHGFFDVDESLDFGNLTCYYIESEDYKILMAESENDYWIPYNNVTLNTLSKYKSEFADWAVVLWVRLKTWIDWAYTIDWINETVYSIRWIDEHDLIVSFYSETDITTNSNLKLFWYGTLDKYCTKTGIDLSCWTYESYENSLGSYIDKVLSNLGESHIGKLEILIDNIPALEQKYKSDEKRVFMFQYLRYKLEQRYLELVWIYWVE